ncbi:hypothetical protein [Anaerosporobacter sp.]|uniref:hypothetical protein n=1 Tax=Anaerosporobacter sp. TaxID=1872529 RepID=UPI00286F3C41|nr:hypothetical protein [Anaerosporobacter sp.]
MEILKNIIEWFIDCFKSIPEGIVSGVFTGLLFWGLRLILNKISNQSGKLRLALNKFSAVWKAQPEIGSEYRVIPTPNYKFPRRNKKSNASSADMGGTLFIVILISSWGSLWLQEHQIEVQTIFYFTSAIFICLGAFFIFISAFTNRIQSSTMKYSIFSIIVSMYIYYSGLILPNLIEKMPDDINMSKLLLAPKEYWPSIYVFFGLLVVVIEIIIILIMLLRVMVIKIDSKIEIVFIRKIIYLTRWLESIVGLIIMFGLLTIFSYMLTSGLFIETIFKMQA